MGNVELNEDQKKLVLGLIREGVRIERERILSAVTQNNSKTISVSKLTKIIENRLS